MILAIDASSANKSNRTGVEWYSYNLLEEMKKHTLAYDESVVLYSPTKLKDELCQMPQKWKSSVLNWPFKKAWMQARVSLEVLSKKPDLLFVPGQGLPRYVPKATVTTIHDIGFKRRPDLYDPKILKKLNWLTDDAIKTSNKIITVSEATKKDLIDLCSINEDRIAVTPISYNKNIYKKIERQSIKLRPFFLFVGRLEAKKNIQMIIEAFEEFSKQTNFTHDLILIGDPGFGFKPVNNQFIKTVGYLPEMEIAKLMNQATALLFPSWYEGFGIPNLEAMACGCPVIASDIPAHREVIGEAGLLRPPENRDAWVEAMNKIVSDIGFRQVLIDRGFERVKQYSWEKTADDTWEVLRSLV